MESQKRRVALVTGGGSGIGFATAKALRETDRDVVIADRDESPGAQRAEAIGAAFIHADLCDRETCRSLVDRVIEKMGNLDILINNAGIQHMAAIDEFPEERWDEILAVTLTAPFLLTKHAFPAMKRGRWGRIVNIASVQGLIASPFKVAYVTAKAGMLGLTRATALEGGEHGITANALCPAFVDTPLMAHQMADQARLNMIDEAQVMDEVFLKSAAIKRIIRPSEIASLVVYLCSDAASAVTGASWTIDLGVTAQ